MTERRNMKYQVLHDFKQQQGFHLFYTTFTSDCLPLWLSQQCESRAHNLLNSKVSNYAGLVSEGILTCVVVRVTGAGALQLSE